MVRSRACRVPTARWHAWQRRSPQAGPPHSVHVGAGTGPATGTCAPHEGPQLRVVRVSGGRRPQVRHHRRREGGLALGGVAHAARPAREVPPDDVALAVGAGGWLAEEPGPASVARELGPGGVVHADGGVAQSVEQSLDPCREVRRDEPGRRRRLARQQEEMIAFLRREAQCPRQRR